MISAVFTLSFLNSPRKTDIKHLATFLERSKSRILWIVILIYYLATMTDPQDKIKYLNQTINIVEGWNMSEESEFT